MKVNNINIDNADSIGKYFKEIRKKGLLTIEDEVELAERIKNGDDSAILELVESNLKFVVSIAKQYQGQGVLLSDLINEGNYGLIKAAKKFDADRGFRFISYAVYWVKQSIIQCLNENGRMIRLPVNVIAKMNTGRKNNELLLEEHTHDVELFDNEYVELVNTSCSSLNEYINEDGDEVSDLISDDINVEELIIKDSDNDKLKSVLYKTLEILDERERCIIECYFGLNESYEAMTLEGIGDKYDLTKERIRQIKEKAIMKLRFNASNLQNLLDK